MKRSPFTHFSLFYCLIFTFKSLIINEINYNNGIYGNWVEILGEKPNVNLASYSLSFYNSAGEMKRTLDINGWFHASTLNGYGLATYGIEPSSIDRWGGGVCLYNKDSSSVADAVAFGNTSFTATSGPCNGHEFPLGSNEAFNDTTQGLSIQRTGSTEGATGLHFDGWSGQMAATPNKLSPGQCITNADGWKVCGSPPKCAVNQICNNSVTKATRAGKKGPGNYYFMTQNLLVNLCREVCVPEDYISTYQFFGFSCGRSCPN